MGLLVEVPHEVILESERILLNKKTLYLEDIIIPENPRSRSYIIAILAFKYKGRIKINSKPVSIELCEGAEFGFSFENGRKMSPEELKKILEYQQEIGDKAESIVFEYEKEKLRKCVLAYLTDEIVWTSKHDCTAGYDILSFDEKGKRIYIEVKGTAFERSNVFKLTGNELNRAKREGEAYYIYHVKNVNSEKTTLSILQNPFKLVEEMKIKTIPSEYVVEYAVDHFNKLCL